MPPAEHAARRPAGASGAAAADSQDVRPNGGESMKRASLLSIVVVSALVGSPHLARACSCGPNYRPSVLDQYNSVDAVFTGIVISVRTHETLTAFDDVEFLVTGFWKGVSTRVVHVLTSKGIGSCGIPFYLFLNQEFVVYADADWIYPSGPLSTHMCTRTTGVENAQEDFEVLGSPYSIPVEESAWGTIKALYE